MAAFLIFIGGLPLPAAADLAPTDIGPTETIGGLKWIADTRVTDSAGAKQEPQLEQFVNGNAHLLWMGAGNPADGYYYASLDPGGGQVQAPTFITNRTIARWGAGYIQATSIGMDSQRNFHVTYDDGWTTIYYEKADRNGSILVPGKVVGPNDGQASHTPTLAVGTDDTIHIAHEEYKFQCEDIAYDKLANDGSEVWIDRVVSSDVASHCEFSLIKVDAFSGNFYFVFGSSTGTWLGRFNKFGVKDMASIMIRTQDDYKITDVAGTPDGSMHLAWADNGTVYYTMVNASGGVKVNKLALTSTITASGFVHVAGTSDNRAVVTWADNASGRQQVYYTVLGPGVASASDVTAPIQLTDSPVAAYQPWVSVDEDDNFHFVWIDERDGSPQVYYKRSFGCRIDLWIQPISPGGSYFLRPDEVRTEPVAVVNRGIQTEMVEVTFNVDPAKLAAGWEVDLSPSGTFELGAGEWVNMNLTIRAPRNVSANDPIRVTINATAQGWPDCGESIDFGLTARVTRYLDARLANSTVYGNAGANVTTLMTVFNLGDVYEDSVVVSVGASGLPAGWPAGVGNSGFPLAKGMNTTLAVWVQTAANTPGGSQVSLPIEVRSGSAPQAGLVLYLKVVIALEVALELVAAPSSVTAMPGERVTFSGTVRLPGNLGVRSPVDLSLGGSLAQGWSVSFNRTRLNLISGELATFSLNVLVPTGAAGGYVADFLISAYFGTTNATAYARVSVVVGVVCGLTFWREGDDVPSVETQANYLVFAKNEGNAQTGIGVSAPHTPAGWLVDLFDEQGPTSGFTLARGETANFSVRAIAPEDARAGFYSIDLRFASPVCGVSMLALPAKVQARPDFWLSADVSDGAAAPGEEAVYLLRVDNRGNVDDTFRLDLQALPAGFTGRLVRLNADGSESPEPVSAPLPLAAGEIALVRLRVQVPGGGNANSVLLPVRLENGWAVSQGLLLGLTVLRPDLIVSHLQVSPDVPKEGDRVVVQATVKNIGRAATPDAEVEVEVNGQLMRSGGVGALAPDETRDINFTWVPVKGKHMVTVRVATPEGFTEVNVTNNQVRIFFDVAALPRSPKPPGAAENTLLIAAGIGALSFALAAVAVAGRRRKGKQVEVIWKDPYAGPKPLELPGIILPMEPTYRNEARPSRRIRK